MFANAMECSTCSQDGPAGEGFQIKWAVIEHSAGFRITRSKDLKTAVEGEPMDDIGTNPTTHAIGGFEDSERDAALCQAPATTEPRETRPENEHIRIG